MNLRIQFRLGFLTACASSVLAALVSLGPLSALAQSPPARATNTTQPPAAALRAYVDFAMRNRGDVSRGRTLFANDQKLACAKCHGVDGSGNLAGPDLAAVGDKFPRRELIRAILDPSASIAVGYGTTIVGTGPARNSRAHQAIDRCASRTQGRGWTGDAHREGRHPGAAHQQRLAHAGRTGSRGDAPGFRRPRCLHGIVAVAGERVRIDAGDAGADSGAAGAVELQPFFDANIRLNRPLWFGVVPGFTNRFVVLEHGGASWLIERTADGDAQGTLVDLSGTVRVGGATGLLGLTFHPKFRENRRYFLKYQIVENGKISTLLVERRFAADFKGDSGEPARQLLKIPSVTQDHNGGPIEFGPDGFLYFGMPCCAPNGARATSGCAASLPSRRKPRSSGRARMVQSFFMAVVVESARGWPTPDGNV